MPAAPSSSPHVLFDAIVLVEHTAAGAVDERVTKHPLDGSFQHDVNRNIAVRVHARCLRLNARRRVVHVDHDARTAPPPPAETPRRPLESRRSGMIASSPFSPNSAIGAIVGLETMSGMPQSAKGTI